MKDNAQNQYRSAEYQSLQKKMRQQSDELMRISAEFQLAAKNSNEILLDYNISEDSIIHLTSQISYLFGLPAKIEHAQDYLIRYGVIQPESIHDFRDLFRRIRSGEPHAECVVRARTAQGELLWIQMILTTFYDDQGLPIHASGVLRDITLQREAELQCVSDSPRRNILARESLVYYEANLTKHEMLFGMESLCKSFGVPNISDYNAALDFWISNVVHPEERACVKGVLETDSLLERYALGQKKAEMEYRRLSTDGSVIWVKGNAYLIENPLTHDIMLYFYVNDINDLKLREMKLRDRTERDPLTNLPNKIATEIHIQEAIESQNFVQSMSALLLISLDELDKKNGSRSSNLFFSDLSIKLHKQCAEHDIIGRNKGFGFILYLQNLSNHAQAKQRAEEIFKIIQNETIQKNFSSSMGVSLFPEQASSFDSLYRCATLALNASKLSGDLCFYQPETEYPALENDSELYFDQEKAVTDHTIEHVFQILYESKNLNEAINSVLKLVAEHYHCNRVYLYKSMADGRAKCAFQWAKPGYDAIPDIGCVISKKHFSAIEKMFESSSICTLLPGELKKDEVDQVDFRTRILYAFRNEKSLQGFVGFDLSMQTDEHFLYSTRKSLQNIMQILDVFQVSRATNDELWESTHLLQSIVDGLHSYTYIIDPSTHLLKYVNQNTKQGIPEAMPGTHCYDTIRGRSEPCIDCPIDRMLRDGTKEDHCEMYLDRYNVWARINSSLISMPSGKFFGVFNGFDFSDHRHNRDEHFVQGLDAIIQDTSLYDALAMSTDDYIFMCDMSTRLFYFPQKMVEEFDLPGQTLENAVEIWAERVHEDERKDFVRELDLMFSGQLDTHNMEYRVRNKDGLWVWVRARGHIERRKDGTPTMFAGVLTNLGSQKSKIDHLTGLQDKYEFEIRVRAQLAESPQKGALLILGLDNFKYINNIYGWEFGDHVLKESAQRLIVTLPEKIELFRLDGDTFGVFFAGTDIDVIKEYYASLFLVFRQHRQFGDHRYFSTISGGCAFFEDNVPSFDILFKQASHALDYSKREGKNRLSFYDENRMGNNNHVLMLLARLYESVENGFENFELYYQPQIHPKTFQIKSAEALLRWKCPEIGMISPVEFIPLLEQSGLINKVGRWVLQQASSTCKKWKKICPGFTISVNISFAQLQDQGFLPYLTDNVTSGLIDPECLHLEITESCIAGGSRSLADAFRAMRNMGFRIEMDDFGTGYSSLEILKNAPADLVKIDHAFVRDITHSDFDATFIRFIVSLCHSVNIPVCLEGVETWDEYALVEAMELDLIQGFLFGRPQPQSEFERHFLNPEQPVTLAVPNPNRSDVSGINMI